MRGRGRGVLGRGAKPRRHEPECHHGSGNIVTCAIHREKAGYSIRTGGQSSLWSHGRSSYLRIDSGASPEDVSIDYDSTAKEFVVAIGKQRIRVEADQP